MGETLAVPVWLALPAALLAAWGAYDKLLVPFLRWILARPANQVIDELSTRLRIGIRPFQRTRRQALIHRLTTDPKVLQAGERYPPDPPPKGPAGGGAPPPRAPPAAAEGNAARRALRARDRAGLQRLPLLSHRLLGGGPARAVALPSAPGLRRHGGHRRNRSRRDGGIRDEP